MLSILDLTYLKKFKLFTYLNKPIQLEPRFCLLKFKQGAIH